MQKVVAVVAVLVVIAFGVLNLTVDFGQKPDAVFPMANRNITWYYAGK